MNYTLINRIADIFNYEAFMAKKNLIKRFSTDVLYWLFNLY